MSLAQALLPPIDVDLPSPFRLAMGAPEMDTFTHACAIADDAGPATIVLTLGADIIDFAVVLAPEEPLKSARRALFIGMSALADALASMAQPERRIGFDWPTTLLYDGARIGGGRLGWPMDCDEDEVPQWLVFSAMLIASKRAGNDPGHKPESTSFEEEKIEGDAGLMVERFARYLLLGFDTYADRGFGQAAERYLYRLVTEDRGKARISMAGDLVIERTAGAEELRVPLLPNLNEPAWLDPESGRPRL